MMDFLDDDDVPSAPAARPVGKFQPKAKTKPRAPPPKKESSAANALVPPQAEDNQVVSSISNIPDNSNSNSVATSNAGAEYASSVAQTVDVVTPSNADTIVSSMRNPRTVSSVHIEENASPKHGEDQCFNSGEPMIESTEVFIRLDSVDVFMPQSTTMAGATFDASSSHYGEDASGSYINQEQLGYKEAAVFNNVEAVQLEKGQMETKGGQLFTSVESFDFMYEGSASSGKIGKFQPELKSKTEKKAATVESVSHSKEEFVIPSEYQNTNLDGLVDGGLTNFPHTRVDDAFSTDPSTGCLLNQVESLRASPDFISDVPSCTDAATECLLSQTEQLLQSSSNFIPDFEPSIDPLNQGELHEASQHDPSVSDHSQNVPGMPEILNENKKGGTVGSHNSEISEETGLEDNCGGNEEGKGSKKKKSSSSSKKDANGSDKSVRKRKKTTEASEKSNERPPKKFSHSTRRRNRCINKALLETPEDEIDYQRLPIKDLRMLAEYRERQNKEVDTGKADKPTETEDRTAQDESTAAPSERNDNNWWEDPLYGDNDDKYTSGQAEGSFDGPSTSTMERDTSCFNYQSHMEKKPRVKWSKQDTELFYEGVRQFGSALSMIQHLFPSLTRHQIKLKYKKEERQHAMRLFDALTNRGKDLSHFQLVVAELQEEIYREEEQQRAEEEAAFGATGNDGNPEEGITETQARQEEAAKSEQNDDGLDTVQDPDGAKIGSPTASNESERDMYDAWSNYRSEL